MSATTTRRASASRPARSAARPARPRTDLRAFRIAAAAVGVFALAAGGYAAARSTSVFAVRTIEVSGGSPRVKAEVRRALAPVLGRSLIAVGGGQVARYTASIPDVVSAHIDRSFPHTLHVTVRPERAVLLVRQGRSSWVVSSTGRVMRKIQSPKRSSLPRFWLPKHVPLSAGEKLPLYDGSLAAAAVAPIAPGAFHGGVQSVVSSQAELTLKLGTGMQVRLGDVGDLRLKLSIAHRIMRIAASEDVEPGGSYVDVSVPERPVLGTTNSTVEGIA
jgi:cell division protein FtsQ